jgi:hypothetical protein
LVGIAIEWNCPDGHSALERRSLFCRESDPESYYRKENVFLFIALNKIQKRMSQRTIFGGAIAVILLGLYVYAVIMALVVTSCLSKAGCSTYSQDSFTSGMALTMATVGGLVSALVIAELAVTKPGESPAARVLNNNPSQKALNILQVTTFAYLSVWTLFGLLAFIVGYLQHPGVLQPLTDLGQSWLGLAVAAAYAYLGVNQKNN